LFTEPSIFIPNPIFHKNKDCLEREHNQQIKKLFKQEKQMEQPSISANIGAQIENSSISTGISAQQLRAFIEKIERLETDKAEVSEQIKETFAHAKSEGFDIKVMRQLIKIRRMKKEELAEQEELLDLYRSALGE